MMSNIHSIWRVHAPSTLRAKANQLFLFPLILVTTLATVVVIVGPYAPQTNVTTSSASVTKHQVSPIDEVAALEVSANIAKITNLPEKAEIANTYTLLKTQQSLQTNSEIISKPQVLPTGQVAPAIRQHTTEAGDTVQTVATKFGVSENSIRWSNKLTTDFIGSGVVLAIPGTDGIIYTVAQDETADSLAVKFKADKEQIISYNDAELVGIKPGQTIVIPNGTLPLSERPKLVYSTPGKYNPVSVPTATVKAGDTIGYIGNTGYSFGAHLHLEGNEKGTVIDPNIYFRKGWKQPVNTGSISQKYNNPSFLYANGYHSGIDYDGGAGAPVRAVADGLLYRGCAQNILGYRNGLGYMAVIDHGNGLKTIYAHMASGPDGGACR